MPQSVDTQPLKICLATAELAPLAKTGGLADVCSALARFLHGAGHDVRLLLPRYAAMDCSGLDVLPVEFLQDIPIRIGNWQGRFSIDTVGLAGTGLPVYLLRCPAFYDRQGIYTQDGDEHMRFVLLSRAAVEMCQHMGFAPDIFHCHDWHAALLPLYLKTLYAWDRLFAASRTVLTIHNIGYQGIFPAGCLDDLGFGAGAHWLHQDDLRQGRVNFLKTGVLHADFLTTVSPTYAREIQGEAYGMGLQDLLSARSGSLLGILNGVDYDEWNPARDPLIPHPYNARSLKGKGECKRQLMQSLGLGGGTASPLIGIVSRLVSQKGIDLMQDVLPGLLRQRDFALAILGGGDPEYENFFSLLQQEYRGRVYFRRGYDNRLAHRIEAGSDIFLMPSRYEPCGLNQMYSLKYGTVPVVRQTGGLADSVEPVEPERGTGTGIVFRDYDAHALRWAITRALDLFADKPLWRRIVRNGMKKDFSWRRQGALYVDLFRRLAGAQGPRPASASETRKANSSAVSRKRR